MDHPAERRQFAPEAPEEARQRRLVRDVESLGAHTHALGRERGESLACRRRPRRRCAR